ncbi:MAG: TlpA disulfide reductase family protein [Eubacteriales bacterium]|nr:TlpA disulfide reductase family protein [Eubacteriales bacterium]MDD4323441.1 TlpA disulfide reductase family protein [Eubacteriales bacterium]MDD4541137.1 TlpA disulfide reductase family protein [Eubacteriales bacterium]
MKINKNKSIKIIILLIALSLLISCADRDSDPESNEPLSSTGSSVSTEATTEPVSETSTSTESSQTSQDDEIFAPDFTLKDQNGVEHTLSDYLGKKIIINFWATWCGPCRAELPLLQEYYVEQGSNEEDLVLLGVANPSTDALSQEMDEAGLKGFIKENGLEYPTLMDHTGVVFGSYAVSALPTSFFIDTDGSIVGYFPGTLNREIIDYAMGQFK